MTCKTSPGAIARRRAAWLCVASCLAMAACATKDSRPPRVKTPKDVEQELLAHLQRIGDLAHYVVDVKDDSGTIVVLVQRQYPVCVPTQKPTSLRQPLDPDNVHHVAAALDLMNQAYAQNQEPRFEPYTLRYECTKPGPEGMKPMEFEEVRAALIDELKSIGALSDYIAAAEFGQPVEIWRFDQDASACGLGQTTFQARQALPKDRLGRVQQAIDNINNDLLKARQPQVKAVAPDRSCDQAGPR